MKFYVSDLNLVPWLFLALFISCNYNLNYAIFIPLEINFVHNSLNLFKFLSESYYFARSSNSPLWDLYNISDELYAWNRDCVNGGRASALLAHNWEKSTLVSEERDETPGSESVIKLGVTCKSWDFWWSRDHINSQFPKVTIERERWRDKRDICEILGVTKRRKD